MTERHNRLTGGEITAGSPGEQKSDVLDAVRQQTWNRPNVVSGMVDSYLSANDGRSFYPNGSPSESIYDWRPIRAQQEITKLTSADRQALQQLETAFVNGDVLSLAQLVEKANPQADANLTTRDCFQKAFDVFQLELGALGFNASYDTKTGVMWLENQNPSKTEACIQRVVIDPNRPQIVETRKDPKTLTIGLLKINPQTGDASELRTTFKPKFNQSTVNISGEELQTKYVSVLKDQNGARIEAIAHQHLDEHNALMEEQQRKWIEADQQFRSEMQRRQEDMRLQQIIDEQRRFMNPYQVPQESRPNF